MEKYIPCSGDNVNAIEIGVRYCKDANPRGYYLTAVPVERRRDEYGTSIGYELFAYTGRKCVKTVTRKSNKAYEEACEIAKQYEQDMINDVCEKRNIIVLDKNA